MTSRPISPVSAVRHDSALPLDEKKPSVRVTLERVRREGKGPAEGSGSRPPLLEEGDGKGNLDSPRNDQPLNSPKRRNVNLTAVNPDLETGVFVTIGKSRFYFKHLHNGEEMAHTREEWNRLIGARAKSSLEELQKQQPDFDPDLHKRLEIDLSAGTVKCSPQADDLPNETFRVNAKVIPFFQALSTTLQSQPGISMQHPAARGTVVAAPYSQSGSPLGEIAKHACTAIAGEFIQTALFTRDGSFLNSNFLKGCIDRGQQNYLGKITPLVEAAEQRGEESWDSNSNPSYEFRNLDDGGYTDCYALLMWADEDIQLDIPSRNSKAFYERLFKDLVSHEDLVPNESAPVAAGITNGRGESYAIVIYRDAEDPTKIKEIVYFDSHSHARENGTPNACAIRFKATDNDPEKAARDAAAFLAQRTPYEESDVGSWNSLSITPFCQDSSWSGLFKAQGKYILADEAADQAQAEADLREAVAEFLHVDNNNYMKESVALAVSQNRTSGVNATAEAGKIAMRSDPSCLRDPQLQMGAFENFQAALAATRRKTTLPLPLRRVEELPSDDEQN